MIIFWPILRSKLLSKLTIRSYNFEVNFEVFLFLNDPISSWSFFEVTFFPNEQFRTGQFSKWTFSEVIDFELSHFAKWPIFELADLELILNELITFEKRISKWPILRSDPFPEWSFTSWLITSTKGHLANKSLIKKISDSFSLSLF